jgi:hypothetical protein
MEDNENIPIRGNITDDLEEQKIRYSENETILFPDNYPANYQSEIITM